MADRSGRGRVRPQRPGERFPRGPLGPNPANDTVVLAGDPPTEPLPAQIERLQRRQRIESRRRRIATILNGPQDGATLAEVRALKEEIRAEGEEP